MEKRQKCKKYAKKGKPYPIRARYEGVQAIPYSLIITSELSFSEYVLNTIND